MTLGEKMLDVRARRGLSVEKAAKTVGISSQTWRYIERGIQAPNRLTNRKLEIFLEEGGENESQHQSDKNV